MKRSILCLSLFLVALLTACQITVTVTTVTITEPASPVEVLPGATVVFKASVDIGSPSAILWSDGSAGGSFNPSSGAETTYTAPSAVGEYTITATVGTSKDTQKVTVNDPLPVNATLTIAGDGISDTALNKDVALPAGASRVYEIKIPAATKEALIVELNQDLALTVYDSAKALFASSASKSFFAAGDAGLTTSLASQARAVDIVVNKACKGSCVFQDAAGVTTVFAKVENKGTEMVSFDLFAYSEDYSDAGEPANNAQAAAIGFATTASGSIESIADLDFYTATTAGTVRLTSVTSVVNLRAQVITGGNLVATLEVNGTAPVSPGTIIKVFSENSRAAAPSASSYTLSITAP